MRRALALLPTALLLASCGQLASTAAAAHPTPRAAAAAAHRLDPVRGIGGIFVKTANPGAQCGWYSQHLGLAAKPDAGTYFFWQLPGNPKGFSTMWFLFPAASNYFAGPCMINYVVDDLLANLARLKAEGVKVSSRVVDDEGGKFGWALDGDGAKIELFEPKMDVKPVPHDLVRGIGGLYLKSANQPATLAWYAEHLGMATKPGEGKRFGWELPGEAGAPPTKLSTTWDVVPASSDAFNGPCMITYIVDDLQATTERLKAEGVRVEAKTVANASGTRGWAYDGEGTKLELWEPAKARAK